MERAGLLKLAVQTQGERNQLHGPERHLQNVPAKYSSLASTFRPWPAELPQAYMDPMQPWVRILRFKTQETTVAQMIGKLQLLDSKPLWDLKSSYSPPVASAIVLGVFLRRPERP